VGRPPSSLQPGLHVKPLSGGATTDLASATLSPLGGIAATGTAAYPLVVDAVTLQSFPLDGGAPTVVATSTDLSILIIVGTSVYFANGFSGTPANTLLSVPLAGGTPQTLVTLGSGTNATASDGTYLYLYSNLNQQNTLAVWPLAGGAVTTLSTSAASVFAAAGGRVYFGQASTCGDGSSQYDVWEIGADKSGLKRDVSGLDQPVAMAADTSYVYVATQAGVAGVSKILKFAKQ
jgi:hypothetical protein